MTDAELDRLVDELLAGVSVGLETGVRMNKLRTWLLTRLRAALGRQADA